MAQPKPRIKFTVKDYMSTPECRDMCSRAREEYFIGKIQLRPVDVSLNNLHPEFFPGKLDDRIARDAEQAVVRFRRRDYYTVANHEKVFATALRHCAVLVKQNCLVEPGSDRLSFGQTRRPTRFPLLEQ